MARNGISVQVHGWREVRAALGSFRGQLPGEVRDAVRESAQVVARDARSRVPLGPGRDGHVKSTVRAVAGRGGYSVRGGGNGYPYYQFLEFGGRVGRNRSVYRPRRKAGRYIYPALMRNDARIRRMMSEGVERAARRAGLRTGGGA